jgi:hypothetical protein
MLDDIPEQKTKVKHQCNTCESLYASMQAAYECYLSHSYSNAITRVVEPDMSDIIEDND